MIKCEICEKELLNNKSLGKHISIHHNMNSKEYYDLYILKNPTDKLCKTCGKETKFSGFKEGYKSYCSLKCHKNDPEYKELMRKIKKENWEDEDFKNKVSKKISKTVKDLWEDNDSIYHSKIIEKI